MTDVPDYITFAEAAAIMGVAVSTVRKRVISPESGIRTMRSLRVIRIHREDWLAYLRRCTAVAAPVCKAAPGAPLESEMQALLRRKAS